MSRPSFFAYLLLLMATIGTASADTGKVVRTVGSDGVPVITIKSPKAASVSKPSPRTPSPNVPPPKEWRVYDLEQTPGQEANENQKPTIIVVSSPPPIAPNYGYGYGYYNAFEHGYYGPIPYPRFRGEYRRRHLGPNSIPNNYQNRPLNYQNRPVNYQNPPVNYRPLPNQSGVFQRRYR